MPMSAEKRKGYSARLPLLRGLLPEKANACAAGS